MIVAMAYHKDGIAPGGILAEIMVEDHPTKALDIAYSTLTKIMPTNERWHITKIDFFPERVDTKSRLKVTAGLKDYPLE